MPPVDAVRQTRAGHEVKTGRPARTLRSHAAFGAEVPRSEQPDPCERGVEVLDEAARDLREHFS